MDLTNRISIIMIWGTWMKFVFILLILIGMFFLHSAEFEITSKIKENPAHLGLQMLDDEYKYDNNGDLCALLIVRCGVEGINFSNTASKVAQIDKQGEYYITMKKGARYIVLKKDGFGSFKETFGLVMKSGSVYEMSADEKFKEVSQIPVMITCNENGAEVFVDGILQGLTANKMLTINIGIGSHKIKVSKDGFGAQEIEKQINMESNSYNFDLIEIQPVMLTIKSSPSGADIFINDVNEGKTNKQLFKFPAEYPLRLSIDKYDQIEEVINVTQDGNNEFNYTFKKNTALLTINTTPKGCNIFINHEQLDENSKEVAAGMYKVEVKKEGYFSENKTITVQEGIDKTETFTLRQKTGKLQFVVEPMEAEVTLKQGNNIIDNWIGSKYLNDLQVGYYTIIVSCEGYKKKNEEFIVELDAKTDISLSLEKEDKVQASSEANYSDSLENVLDKIEKTSLDPYQEGITPVSYETTPKGFIYYDEPPSKIKESKLIYPKFANLAGISGTVVLEIEVLTSGKTGAIEVTKSVLPGPGGLDEAAINYARDLEFLPAKAHGKPVAVWVTYPVTFSLD